MKDNVISLKKWKPYELIWLATFTLIASIITLKLDNNMFSFSVFITGVLCVVLAAKGNLLTYFFGMYNTIGYAFLAYKSNLFGEFFLNILFFVPMNILGFILWKRKSQNNIVEMKKLSVKNIFLVVISSVISILILGFFLSKIKNQNNPFIDSATNILSIFATILMVYRFREQWLLYIILNIFTVILWSIRLFNNNDALLMVLMWSAYLVNSVYGFYIWNKGVK